MKIKSLTFVILLITFLNINAQEFSIGIKGGINYSSIGDLYHYGNNSGLGVNVTPDENTVFNADKAIGTNFGIFFMVEYDRFYIRPEVIFSSLKNSYNLAFKEAEWTATKIDIPVLFGYKVYNNISIYAGPGFSSITDMELTGPEYPIMYDETSINLNAGIFADFGVVGLDLRYEYGISKVDEQRVDIDRGIYGTNIADLLEYNPSQISICIHLNIANLDNTKGNRRSKSGWRNHKNL